MENQSPPKRKGIGRTRRALRAIRDFIDRQLTAKTVIAVTILLLLASWIYPPWILGSYRNVSHGWFFVFDTTRETAMRVDFGRLFLIDAVIAAAGGLFAWAVYGNSIARRVTVRLFFCGLILPPLIAVVCLAAVVISEVQREVGKRAQIRPFNWSTGALIEEPRTSSLYDAIVTYLVRPPVTVDVPGHGLAEFPAGMSSEEITAVIKKKFKKPFDPFKAGAIPINTPFDPDKYLAETAPLDLKKITLFE